MQWNWTKYIFLFFLGLDQDFHLVGLCPFPPYETCIFLKFDDFLSFTLNMLGELKFDTTNKIINMLQTTPNTQVCKAAKTPIQRYNILEAKNPKVN